MRFWRNADGCCCGDEGCAVVTGTAYLCCDTNPLAGATVTLRLLDGLGGSTHVSTTTTAIDGTYSLPVYENGPYDVLIEYPGCTDEIHTITGPYGGSVLCGDPGPYTANGQALQGDGIDWVCTCGNCADPGPCAGTGVVLHPATLYLSDGVVTITMHAQSPGWVGCTTKSVTGRTESGVNCTGEDVTVTTPVTYTLSCTVGGLFALTITAPCCPSTSATPKHLVDRGSCGAPTGFECSIGASGEPTSCSPLAVTMEAGADGNMPALYDVGHVFTLSE